MLIAKVIAFVRVLPQSTLTTIFLYTQSDIDVFVSYALLLSIYD